MKVNCSRHLLISLPVLQWSELFIQYFQNMTHEISTKFSCGFSFQITVLNSISLSCSLLGKCYRNLESETVNMRAWIEICKFGYRLPFSDFPSLFFRWLCLILSSTEYSKSYAGNFPASYELSIRKFPVVSDIFSCYCK